MPASLRAFALLSVVYLHAVFAGMVVSCQEGMLCGNQGRAKCYDPLIEGCCDGLVYVLHAYNAGGQLSVRQCCVRAKASPYVAFRCSAPSATNASSTLDVPGMLVPASLVRTPSDNGTSTSNVSQTATPMTTTLPVTTTPVTTMPPTTTMQGTTLAPGNGTTMPAPGNATTGPGGSTKTPPSKATTAPPSTASSVGSSAVAVVCVVLARSFAA
ncbi:hypothetical protein SPRG_16944 [Saprolegnia parasitica CBS 223.65]|uniref:Uncharacterized protein n=1 Tax=Saprolegnia parasitica (strain CBS 223.65) TaxID=695850 RepID=A0A067BSN8_SAPPC|nr:hypothetical protein SPRG_16944 [Saprolegnia parasitica CBS 223.65]KDO17662.1 hypothetical protein SPRG_16944 [Saprolegnia parasitica CBS 223.65]|eukprot:XP_012211630.1 hypothetical protein SPRG_16944 [Saprolegnia parasitica CBS 223.65]